MIAIDVKVLEAAQRLLDNDVDSYPGLTLTGDQASARQFHDDVVKVAEWVASVATEIAGHA
jgi:hypothetical protein